MSFGHSEPTSETKIRVAHVRTTVFIKLNLVKNQKMFDRFAKLLRP